MKRFEVRASILLCLAAALAACDDGDPMRPGDGLTPVAIDISSPDSGTLVVGDALRLAATVTNDRGEPLDVRIVWTSSAAHVASVDSTGFVHALQRGTAVIRAATGVLADSVVVTVWSLVESLEVIAPTLARQGDVVQLKALLRWRNGAQDTLTHLAQWRLLDAGAAIDSLARFIGETAGATVRVEARYADALDTLAITVAGRGLSGSFTSLGEGRVQNRTTSDLWVWRAANGRDYALTGTLGTCTTVCGDRVYVWDVTDPSAITLTDSVALDARRVNDVKISADGRFAVATHEGSGHGISILSLADPAHPAVLTHYTQGLGSGVHNIWIERLNGRDYVFAAANGSGGLRIIDVTAAVEGTGTPTEVAQYYEGTSFVHDVYVRDGMVFVSHWNAGLVVLDIRDWAFFGPRAPQVRLRIGLPRRAAGGGCCVHNAWYWPERRLLFIGEERFVETDPGRVHVVQLDNNLFRYQYVASYSLGTGDPPHNFWVDEANAILFVGWYDHGLRAIDVQGALLGALERQGREFATATAIGPPGGIWAPQLHHGTVFASEMEVGLRSFRFAWSR